ncbi:MULTISPECIES: Uma2 family endonuclease [unclassified Microcoleus]|uniref:Uma2 family endonuclease n=1 Tax=unclassified Microcoleus TaxID=2642155 RepID=UPI002FD2333E
MVQALTKIVTFDEFIAWYPENSEYRYELHNGVIVEMPKGTGQHSEISGFLNIEVGVVCRNGRFPYFLPKECVLKPDRTESGYEPDIIVLDRQQVINEPRWAAESIITMGSSVRLAVEVVSSNWQNDYLTKLRDYEEMGIFEYWIVDYLGLGGRRYIGNPKQPTLSLYQLVDGEYELTQFRGDERIESAAFPELNLTAQQVFDAGIIIE